MQGLHRLKYLKRLEVYENLHSQIDTYVTLVASVEGIFKMQIRAF